jgi:hypothetical protein
MENTGFDDRYFKVYSLSKSREEGSWGRYSPEGKEIFRQALNGEYEPEDSFNRDWDREQWKSDDDEPMNIDK